MDGIKINDNTIQITKESKIEPIITSYDYDFLISQRIRIISDANEYIDSRKKELDEIDEILSKCREIGIVGKTIPDKLI